MIATSVFSFIFLMGLSLPFFLSFVSVKLTGSGFHKIILMISLFFFIISALIFFNLMHQEFFLFIKSLYYWPTIIGLIAGNILFTMILGHYYLVVPKLTVKPLLYNLKFLFGLMLVRLFFVYLDGESFGLWRKLFITFFSTELLTNSWIEFGIDSFQLVLFLFQQLSCYLAIPILAFFSYKLCLMRSTQSATGIFYVMVFFSFVGDLVTLYFYYNNGVMI